MDAILINKSDTSQSCSLSVSYADAMQNYERRGTFGIGAIEGGDRRLFGNSKYCCKRGTCYRLTMKILTFVDIVIMGAVGITFLSLFGSSVHDRRQHVEGAKEVA